VRGGVCDETRTLLPAYLSDTSTNVPLPSKGGSLSLRMFETVFHRNFDNIASVSVAVPCRVFLTSGAFRKKRDRDKEEYEYSFKRERKLAKDKFEDEKSKLEKAYQQVQDNRCQNH
jgi:hypothetical protein